MCNIISGDINKDRKTNMTAKEKVKELAAGFQPHLCLTILPKPMAQLRQDYDQFVSRDVAVVVVSPEDAKGFAAYWQKESLPFIVLPDPKAGVIKRPYSGDALFMKLTLDGDVIWEQTWGGDRYEEGCRKSSDYDFYIRNIKPKTERRMS